MPSLSSILNVLSIIATIGTPAGVIWALFKFFRRKRYPGRIAYACGREIYLFHDLIERFPDLRVTFLDKEVDGKLIAVSGFLVNSGERDLSSELVEDPLNLELPQGFEWREVTLSGPSEKKCASYSISGKVLEIGGHCLIKINEVIAINALVASPKDGGQPKVSISHRIKDFEPNVVQHDLSDDFFEGKRIWEGKISVIVAIIFLAVIGVVGAWRALTSSANGIYFSPANSPTGESLFELRSNVHHEVFAIDRTTGDRLPGDIALRFSSEEFVPSVPSTKMHILLAAIQSLWILMVGVYIALQNFPMPGGERSRVRRSIQRHLRPSP